MKISELISALQQKLGELGDIDVWARYSCGCCGAEDDPDLSFVEGSRWEPGGLYVN